VTALDRLWTWLTEPLEERVDLDVSNTYPDIDYQLYQRQNSRTVPYTPTVRDALGVPAIWRAVSLLATTVGSLQLKEYVNQIEVDPGPFVRRPSRSWTPGDFFRDMTAYMASRGEAIALITARDFTGFASDVRLVAPYLMQSEWDGLDHEWRFTDTQGRQIPIDRANVIHITLMRDEATGRGIGPLQRCGVALNVAVEADRWASRFYVGGVPSVFLDSANPINATEAEAIKEQWLTDPPNVPKVGHGFTPSTLQVNPEVAQLVQSRMHSRGDAAVAFGIPGKLLEYASSGSSLTYQNVGDLATELVRLTLAPQYLEPIEQHFSDLLPRGHEVRFDVEGFQRADVKTRYEVYTQGIDAGIFTPEYAAQQEGILGGSPEVRPVPIRRVS
jgi:HK97 family phage portal protein